MRTKILEPTHRTIECFPHPHFTSTLIKAYLQYILALYILSSYQEKNYKASQKLKTQFEETHEATEPDMARVLELPDREFKATASLNLKPQVWQFQRRHWTICITAMLTTS